MRPLETHATSGILPNISTVSIRDLILGMSRRARAASRELTKLGTTQKNEILYAMAQQIRAEQDAILAANVGDVERAKRDELNAAIVDRLRLNAKSLESIAVAIENVAALPDPVGEVLAKWRRPNGLRLQKVRVPIGVIAIIYESRPNVTSDAAALCFKAGNATILRGGSEAIESNRAIVGSLQRGGKCRGLPAYSIQFIDFTERESVDHLATMDDDIDLIIPRGGHALIERIVRASRIPVLKHYHGICHVYVHCAADFDMAAQIILNGKCQKPGVCNALETLLVDRAIAKSLYPKLAELLRTRGVEIRGDAEVLSHWPGAKSATEEDWRTEYLDLILSIKTVASLEEAIAHINGYGSHHTDAIVTNDKSVARTFLQEVDSAVVLWNASTRFNDGGEFGFGAEIGISTDKLHARGPMALAELCSYKYIVTGNGQVRS